MHHLLVRNSDAHETASCAGVIALAGLPNDLIQCKGHEDKRAVVEGHIGCHVQADRSNALPLLGQGPLYAVAAWMASA